MASRLRKSRDLRVASRPRRGWDLQVASSPRRSRDLQEASRPRRRRDHHVVPRPRRRRYKRMASRSRRSRDLQSPPDPGEVETSKWPLRPRRSPLALVFFSFQKRRFRFVSSQISYYFSTISVRNTWYKDARQQRASFSRNFRGGGIFPSFSGDIRSLGRVTYLVSFIY